ncbi:MAG: glycoside hydrolase, partial [Clostridia bacterium]|nr:glycoside hydrolase [Clostridia bacterium]
IVNLQAFQEQMQTLKASGYQTITQEDVIRAYQGGNLPEKAMLLIFEDGIYDSALWVQPTLVACNYKATMCTYAGNLSDNEQLYVNAKAARELMDTTYWEMGSNGYRLSYINIFDRYQNYFGHMNTAEFLKVHNYLRRDYNHYLMDFLRDENRLRQESVEAMEKRIEWDYMKMDELYRQDFGFVPSLYILMHSNTGAYGNDPLVSRKNEEMMQKVFGMNFNRQGTCLNMMDSSIYDLSRLQARQYFSSNHLMMRIWDDTGHPVMFRLGDEEQAKAWQRLEGVAEYSDHRIILTSMPYGKGTILLEKELPPDFDLSVRLQGNVVGQQSISLKTDDHGEGGVTVCLHNNCLYILDPAGGEPLFELDLLEFDGGPYESIPENELAGKIACCEAIIASDEDEERRAEAQTNLNYLQTLRVLTLADGAEPYIPDLDIDEQDDRKLRIQYTGSRISLWLDDRLVVDHLKVPESSGTRLALGAEVTMDNERFSQTNLSDDVYDAVFRDLRIANNIGPEVYAYAEPLQDVVTNVGFVDRVIRIFRRVFD